MKKCSRCRIEQSFDNFWLDKKTGYYHSWCNKCQRDFDSSPHKKKYHRNWHLKRKFGLSQDIYTDLLSKQNNSCAVCGSTSTAKNQSFHVDHDHITGRIRGLLCHNCNRGIGYLKDSPELCSKAATYLK